MPVHCATPETHLSSLKALVRSPRFHALGSPPPDPYPHFTDEWLKTYGLINLATNQQKKWQQLSEKLVFWKMFRRCHKMTIRILSNSSKFKPCRQTKLDINPLLSFETMIGISSESKQKRFRSFCLFALPNNFVTHFFYSSSSHWTNGLIFVSKNRNSFRINWNFAVSNWNKITPRCSPVIPCCSMSVEPLVDLNLTWSELLPSPLAKSLLIPLVSLRLLKRAQLGRI